MATGTRSSSFVSVLAVLLVGAAVLHENLRERSESFVCGDSWIVSTTRVSTRGWPWDHFERTDTTMEVRDSPPYTARPTFKRVTLDYWNPRYWAAIANATLALAMLIATAAVCEYWRCQRKRPLQFSLGSLLVATAAVAVALMLIDHHVIGWWSLLSLPLAAGLVSLPAVAGLGLAHLVRRNELRHRRRRLRVLGAF